MDELQTDLVSNDVVKNSKEEKNLKKDSILLKNINHKIKTWFRNSRLCYCCKTYIYYLRFI